MKLTDAQWTKIEPLIPLKEKITKRKGRPFICPRKVLDGVLWVLKTGARWKDLPEKYGSGKTCHRRFTQWNQQGIFKKMLQMLAEHLKEIGAIDLTETYIDATFIKAKKGALKSVKPRQVKALKSWQLQTVMVFLCPYALQVLHHMRVNLLKKRFGTDILKTYLIELWVTKLTIAMPWMLSLQSDIESNLLLPISQIEKSGLKMVELLDATSEDGKSNDFLLGFMGTEELQLDGTIAA